MTCLGAGQETGLHVDLDCIVVDYVRQHDVAKYNGEEAAGEIPRVDGEIHQNQDLEGQGEKTGAHIQR